MNQTKLIKHRLTGYFNKKELNYREMIQSKENAYNSKSKWVSRINDGRLNILSTLCSKFELKGEILELGAGSCWLGASLSRLRSIEKIYCLDMSEFVLMNVAPHIIEYLKADSKKIIRVMGDFNKLEFVDSKFDYVLFDASLHHIQDSSFNRVLKEVSRVLKIDGKVIAIREPFLCPLFKKYGRVLFGLHEKKYGVTENIFTKGEWRRNLTDIGFKCHFIPYSIQISNKLTLKNVIKRIIKYSPLRIPFQYFFINYFIILEK